MKTAKGINIQNDPSLVREIERERQNRDDATLTKTAKDLLRERLAQIESRQSEQRQSAPAAA